jgi:pyruvate/oxaloacetate carboxyltransferase
MHQTNQIVTLKQARHSPMHFLPAALWISVGVITLMFMLTGCASTPQPPNQAIQAAELAINNAEQARVADYASPELAEAREKLTAARLAVEKKDMVAAHRFAEQSRADADLATAKTGVAKAKAVNDEMKKSTSTLKQEMQRNSGEK